MTSGRLYVYMNVFNFYIIVPRKFIPISQLQLDCNYYNNLFTSMDDLLSPAL